MSAQVTAADFDEIRWKGHWIWVPEDKIEMKMALPGMGDTSLKESHGLFRKTFQLAALPARVPARITADSRYTADIYCEGETITRIDRNRHSSPRLRAFQFFAQSIMDRAL